MMPFYLFLFSDVVVERAYSSVAQRIADVSVFRRLFAARAAIRFIQRFARCYICRFEDHTHPVVKDHQLRREHVHGSASHLRFRGGCVVVFTFCLL